MNEEVKFFNVVESDISSIPVDNGSIYFLSKSKELFCDLNGSRFKISDIVILDTESDKSSIVNPISSKLYFVVGTNTLYLYYGSKWIPVNHFHSNKDVLDELSDFNGNLEYNGEQIYKIWHGTKEEYDDIPEKDENWTYIVVGEEENYLLQTGDSSNTIVNFSESQVRENLSTGEKLSLIFGKISKWLSDLKSVAFSGDYNDLTNKPEIDTELNSSSNNSISNSAVSNGLNSKMDTPSIVRADCVNISESLKTCLIKKTVVNPIVILDVTIDIKAEYVRVSFQLPDDVKPASPVKLVTQRSNNPSGTSTFVLFTIDTDGTLLLEMVGDSELEIGTYCCSLSYVLNTN